MKQKNIMNNLAKCYCLFLFLLPTAFVMLSAVQAFPQGVAINSGGNNADTSAMLDVASSNKGMLMPRVALSGTTDVTTIVSPANGLVVYNTNAAMANGNGVGFYYYCSSGCTTSGWKYMVALDNGPGMGGQILTSGGAGAPLSWTTPTASAFVKGQLTPNIPRWAMPGWNVTRGDISTPLSAGVIYYIPFYYATTTTASEIAVYVTNAVGGSTVDLRVFAWNNGVPGAQVANLGTISSASTGNKTMAINVTFPAGLYFMSMRASTSNVFIRAQNFSYPISGPVSAIIDTNNPPASDWCDRFIMTVTSAYTDPAPAPTAVQLGFPFFLLREN